MPLILASSNGFEGIVTILVILFWVVSRILGGIVKKSRTPPLARSAPGGIPPPPAPAGRSPEDELRRFLEQLTVTELPQSAPPMAERAPDEDEDAEAGDFGIPEPAPMPPPRAVRRHAPHITGGRSRMPPMATPAEPPPLPATGAVAAGEAPRWYEDPAAAVAAPLPSFPRSRVSMNSFRIPGIRLPSLRWGSVGSQSTGFSGGRAGTSRGRGLDCPGGLRRAIVLRTILGPPRALSPMDPDETHAD